MGVQKKIEHTMVSEVLQNILTSPEFASSPRVSAALQYVVEETLAGRADRIKAYTIAVDVLQKDDGFDPSSNPIVRVLAGRLREALAAFYSSPIGLDQAIVITIPKGSYVPVFSRIDNRVSPEFGGEATDVKSPQPFSRTIAIEKFEVFSLEAVTDSSGGRSDLVSTGLQFELIDKLSRFKDIVVIEVDSDNPSPSGDLMDGNPSQYSLSGKIRLSGARIIISSILRRADDNAIIWSKSFDNTFNSTDALFDIQTSIASDIAAALGQPYGTIGTRIAAVRSRLGEMDLDHYSALVDFYQFMNNKTQKQYDEVLENLVVATTEVPEFSSAWAALSLMYGLDKYNVNKETDVGEVSAKALSAAYNAINADPNNAMAYQYLAIAKFNAGDNEGFRKAARISLNLNPNDAEVLADMGSHFIQLDNSDEGKLMVEKAMHLSPAHPPWYHLSLTIYHYTRHESERAIYHAGQFAQERSLSAYILLTASLAQANRTTEAEEVYQKLLLDRPVFAADYQRILDEWPLPGEMTKSLLTDLIKAGLQERVVTLETRGSNVTEFSRLSS